MKCNVPEGTYQPDPYIIKENDTYYIYASGRDGVGLFVSKDKINWEYRGFCHQRKGKYEYWAPSVTKINGKFYMYNSCVDEGEEDMHKQTMYVSVSDTPEGPFVYLNDLCEPFSIDSHVVISGGELFMFYSINDYEAERAGTLIVVDKMKSPTEMVGNPQIVVRGTLDEEIFMKDRFRKGQHWHTLEGAFYFFKDGVHYLMYSGNCYQNVNYYIGYATSKDETLDLTKVKFRKHPDENTYAPLFTKTDKEEGTGHNSVLVEDGRYYVFYHGRDWGTLDGLKEKRTARIAEISVDDGEIKVIDR